MLISTKQRAQSIQLLPDSEINSINSAYSNRSSSPRSSCSSTSSSNSSEKNSNPTHSQMPRAASLESNTTDNITNTTNNLNNSTSKSEENTTSDDLSSKIESTEINIKDNISSNHKIDSVDEIYKYWKNFEIQKLKNDLNEQIEDILQRQTEHDSLSEKYAELNRDLKKHSNEDILKTVSPYLNAFQLELDNFSNRCKTTETNSIDLFKLLTNVPDPFPVIELVHQFNETDVYEQIEKLQTENKDLKEALNAYSNEINLMTKQTQSKQSEEDKELIYHLSEQVGITTQLNLELTSKLKLSEGEIESYKKILVDYQNEISEMKVKHLNEIKNEYHKESDKLKKSDSDHSQISETSIKSSNGINNSTTKSDKLMMSDTSNKSPNYNKSSEAPATTSNKWTNGLSGAASKSHTDKLALLQNLTALSTSLASNNSAAALQASSSIATLKNLLTNSMNKEKETDGENNHQFKPIYKIKNEDIMSNDKINHSNNNDTAYDSSNENDFDDNESDLLNHKSSSPSCTSPIQTSSNANSSNYEPINTADIAQKVRDLLSIHNIGQRVFAKFILGLSQGTVSELLSKPKHWDKLTEKGRESYRKMYNWSCSEQSISTLKAISPRKGNKDNYFYQNGGKEDSVTEDRINQILSEAQKQMQNKVSMHANLSGSSSPSVSSAISPSNTGSPLMSPNSHQDSLQKTSNFLVGSRQQKYEELMNNYERNNNYENDEEMTNDESNNEDEPDVRSKTKNKRSNDESCPLDLTVKPIRSQNNGLKKVKTENDVNYSDAENSDFNVKKTEKQFFNNGNKNSISALNVNSQSPLKHIQSIADAYLISQFDQASSALKNSFSINQQQSPNSFQRPSSTPSPSLSNHGNQTSSKALKCILPPVSQEQFDRYAFINTEELVKKVKDLLSKFSISQRLFGECILGLSQGSVSDLLARPKPWQMLTQKGREPFIRMQMFIDDPEAIKKLMANQYKAPSDKTSRSNSTLLSNSGLQFDSKDNLSKIVSQTLSQNLNGLKQPNAQSLSQMFANISHTQNLLNFSQQQLQQHAAPNNENSNDSEMKTQFQPQINIIPYDISTMSAIGDLNTEEITNRVKETLLNNNIGQKLFGEAVLNLSQGTVSELLSKPKPWNTLSIKGREPYLRMYMWLNDLMRLEKLNEWKEEKNLLKRNSTEVESDHQKPKRRFIFSEDQKDQLMKAFKYDPYPAVNQMEALATKLNLQTRTVINWFHNHRMRIRYKNSTSNNNSGGSGHGMSESPNGSSSQLMNRSRSNNQFNEFTKSLSNYSNNGSRSASIGNEQRNSKHDLSQFNGFNTNANNNHNASNNFYNYANSNGNENMNDEEEPAFDDEDEYNNNIDEDQNDKDNYNEVNNEEDDEPSRTKAALALLNNAYNLPRYFSTPLNKFQNYENDQKQTEDEDEEDDEEEVNDSSLQDDLDTDQEAEINSMYIPGDSDEQNDDQNNENAWGSDNIEDNNLNKHIYMSHSADSNNKLSNKRRKPHNPQKLSFALNLLNSKLQNKQRISEIEVSKEQDGQEKIYNE